MEHAFSLLLIPFFGHPASTTRRLEDEQHGWKTKHQTVIAGDDIHGIWFWTIPVFGSESLGERVLGLSCHEAGL